MTAAVLRQFLRVQFIHQRSHVCTLILGGHILVNLSKHTLVGMCYLKQMHISKIALQLSQILQRCQNREQVVLKHGH